MIKGAVPVRRSAFLLALLLGLGGVVGAGAPAVAAGPHDPFGNVERVIPVPGGVRLVGWAIDPDTSAPLYLWVTVDDAGRHVRADRLRPDVGAAYPGRGAAHGIDATVPATPGAHRVCVVASNVGPGAHAPLGCRTVTVLGGAPLGNLERVSTDAAGVGVEGWALDGDTTQPVYVWVTVDGVGRHLLADRVRPDLAAAFPGYGPAHGVAGTVAAGPGLHHVCVTVSGVGPGGHRALGCRDVVVAGAVRRTAYEDEVLRLSNVARTGQGVAALEPSACAQGQAVARATALAGATALAHAPLEPVLTACGASRAGENLARGYWSAPGMVDAWLASPGHRANLLDERFTALGVGCVVTTSGATLCSQVFLG